VARYDFLLMFCINVNYVLYGTVVETRVISRLIKQEEKRTLLLSVSACCRTIGQTEGQADRQIDRQTDRRTCDLFIDLAPNRPYGQCQ